MHRSILPWLLALACGPALATGPVSPTPQGPNAYALHHSPQATVEPGACLVRGGVWGIGPRPFITVALVDADTGQVFLAQTNFHGLYAIDIPLTGAGRVLHEHVLDRDHAAAIAPRIDCKVP